CVCVCVCVCVCLWSKLWFVNQANNMQLIYAVIWRGVCMCAMSVCNEYVGVCVCVCNEYVGVCVCVMSMWVCVCVRCGAVLTWAPATQVEGQSVGELVLTLHQ